MKMKSLRRTMKRNDDSYFSILKKLIILEIVICIIAFIVGHLTRNMYFRGVGVGLLISWVTGVLAIFITILRKKKK